MKRKLIQIQAGTINGAPALYALDDQGAIWMNLRPPEWNSWTMIFPGFPTPPMEISPAEKATSDLLADELHLKQKKVLGVEA